jgi:hypothetical protein
MSDRHTDELDRWLAAEQAGALDEADALFSAVARRHLPPLEEPAGLSAAIMAALPRRRAAGWLAPFLDLGASRWAHATVAAAVAVLGVAFATMSLDRLVGFSSWSVEALARVAAGTVAALAAVAGVCGATLGLILDLGRAAAVVAGSGAAPALIAANLLVASLAFLGLFRLLSPREEFP